MFLIVVSIVICLLYFALIIVFCVGWKRIFSFEPKGLDTHEIMVSVVVACRNEQDNILPLISSLAQQSYQNFELIFVNDHSTDATRNYIKTAQVSYPKIQLIDAVGYGKKNAIKEGILKANFELIITTDADCVPAFHWVESILSYYLRFPSDLIICPIGIKDNYSLFSRLQALEFVSLVGAAAGSAGVNRPILCNGANLAFRKSVWLSSQTDLHYEEQSGDDIFLLESVKKHNGKIRFLKSEGAFVKTKASKSILEFIKQRRRWASKSTLYSDWQIILTAITVLAISLLGTYFVIMSFFSLYFLIGYGFVFIFKYTLDTYFLYQVRRFFQLDNIWAYALVLSIFYPFYIVFVALSSFIYKPKKWK